MKTTKKFIAIISMLAIIISCFSFTLNASAATAVSSVNCQNTSNKYGGKSVYFYVKANSSTCKIKFSCGKGELDWGGGDIGAKDSVRGAYQVKIIKWDPQKNCTVGSLVYDEDIYNKSSFTASFKATKGAYYRVQVYFWVAETTAKSYWNKGIISNNEPFFLSTRGIRVGSLGTPSWVKFPTIKAANNSGCTLYASKP